MANDNVTDEQFSQQLEARARQKAKDIANLMHQQKAIIMEIARAKEYLEQINAFLKSERRAPILLTEASLATRVGTPGNRSKTKPLRKIEWEGRGLNSIIQEIIDSTPSESLNAERILPKVFEINSPTDRAMVIRDVRSTLQTGSRQGFWNRVGRGLYKSKKSVQQRMPVNA